MRVLISGIGGFYGSHLARFISEKTDWEVLGIQREESKICTKRIGDKYQVLLHDLGSPLTEEETEALGEIDYIFHLAACSHVDRSITNPGQTVIDNVFGTYNMLNLARNLQPKKFIYFSTDEVFGPNKGKKFKEWDRFNPGSPYAATKAAGEDLSLSYHNTYGVPVIITHCMNIFGEMQHSEKFIPKAIKLIMNDQVVPIYADKTGKKSGSRSYIYTDDVSRGLKFILDNGEIGEKYNIEGSQEISNLEMAQLIAKTLDKKLKTEMVTSDNVRPGNDFSYGIDGSKLKKMGWVPKEDIMKKLNKVIRWYMNHPEWLEYGKD